jgi:cell wall-associated NlpC family hydrolase
MPPILHRSFGVFQRNVRRGFLIAALLGTTVLSSTLYATIAMLPYFQLQQPPLVSGSLRPMLSATRDGVPSELAWFFVQYSYLSGSVHIREKNHHTFVVSDGPRGREYVIRIGQNFRRVEIYFAQDKTHSMVHVYSPGKKRTVDLRGVAVVSDETRQDPNVWMWQSPLWNTQQVKIYALADFWLDSPYKKFSCAGFVHQYLKDAGVHVPILDAWDMAKLPWMQVPVDELEPGDIVTIRAGSEQHRRFWHHRITHVGVYLGNGKIIHASTPSYKARRSYIRIATLDQFRGRIDKILRPPELL